MIIHTVKSGDTIYKLANRYGISQEQITSDNQIIDPNNLVLGQALVIDVSYMAYTVDVCVQYTACEAYGKETKGKVRCALRSGTSRHGNGDNGLLFCAPCKAVLQPVSLFQILGGILSERKNYIICLCCNSCSVLCACDDTSQR